MDSFNIAKQEADNALNAITTMISRSEKAQEKFTQGTSQHTLQKNRIKALYIALFLIKKELAESDESVNFTKEDFEKALAPINSLISKSEKVQMKLTQGSWQHTMLKDNINALYRALSLLKNEIS